MMPPVNNPLAGKDQIQSPTTRKTSCPARPQDAAIKCPRCESPNTKFCYYNNYSLTQPRHFCKTCRRYWTNGGALRNVPIGGACRKNKKLRSSQVRSGDSTDSSGSSDVGGLKFFQGISPAMDFQLGWINTPRLHPFNQFSSFGDLSANSAGISANPCFNLESSLMGFSFPSSSSLKQGDHVINTSIGFQEMGSMNIHNNLASSIEDMHWKLQQRRLAVEDNQKENSTIPSGNIEHLIQKPRQIPFHHLENSKADSCLIGTSTKDGPVGNLSTELFVNAAVAPAQAPTTSSNNFNDNTSNWSGIQAWTELTEFSSLPWKVLG